MKNTKDTCLNCTYQLSNKDKYCPQCGQKAEFQNLSFKHLFSSFLDSFLNFDNRLFKTLKDIWIPNKIIRKYMSGQVAMHIHPFRLLFMSLVLFFGLISISFRNFDFFPKNSMEKQINNYQLFKNYQNYLDKVYTQENACLIDSITESVFNKELKLDSEIFSYGRVFGVDFKTLGITTKDVYTLTEDELFGKYGIKSRKDKIVVRQFKRIKLYLDQSIKFIVANMLWGLILLTILMAWVLKLLYIRHKSYFLENLFHIVIFHAQMLLLFSVLLVVNYFIKLTTGVFLIVSFIPIVYLFYNLMTYYHQGYIKTFIKFIFITIGYYFVLVMIMTIIALLSLLFF